MSKQFLQLPMKVDIPYDAERSPVAEKMNGTELMHSFGALKEVSDVSRLADQFYDKKFMDQVQDRFELAVEEMTDRLAASLPEVPRQQLHRYVLQAVRGVELEELYGARDPVPYLTRGTE